MGALKQQFFPTSDRPEVLVEVRLPEGTSIETTTATVEKLEHWLGDQPEAKIVTSYIGQGAPRFFFAMAPELPDPAFAKIVVLTPDTEAREALKHRLREAISQGLAPEAYVRVTQLVFGPYTPFPVEFRVMQAAIIACQPAWQLPNTKGLPRALGCNSATFSRKMVYARATSSICCPSTGEAVKPAK